MKKQRGFLLAAGGTLLWVLLATGMIGTAAVVEHNKAPVEVTE